MRYIVDMEHDRSEKIKTFIETGKYCNFAQFITTAIENQIYLEEADSSTLASSKEDVIDNSPSMPHIISFTKIIDHYKASSLKNSPIAVPLPSFEQLCYFPQNMEEDKSWLWGQINKIFPIKVGLRVLCSMLGNEQWIDLETFKEKATNIALEIASTIRADEDRKKKIRGELISVGLPSKENFKSGLRYKGHFLASLRSDKKLDGAMCLLKFANIQLNDKGKASIGLTKQGLTFAKLENPVIDTLNFDESLGKNEVEFYLNHISSTVKCEVGAVKWLLRLLNEGVTKRGDLNRRLAADYGTLWNASEAVINTQRAGLMARMFELRLIDRNKDGISVKYKIVKRGAQFL